MSIGVGQAILLGIIQGLTEFLPVSSSGHLVIVQMLLGLNADMLMFDVFVHVGTLVAVFVAFWSDIKQLILHPINRFLGLILIACIPTGLIGVFLDDIFENLFSSVVAVAIALIVTGILLVLSDSFHGEKTIKEMKVTDALLVGVLQGVAITPGLSRSGTTIFGSLLLGLRREDAARFSFIVSIPVILGATLKEGAEMVIDHAFVMEWTYFLAAAVAAATGYLAIRLCLRLLKKQKMRYFSYYVWAVALVVLVVRFFAA